LKADWQSAFFLAQKESMLSRWYGEHAHTYQPQKADNLQRNNIIFLVIVPSGVINL
jgi:hypothetical protein